MMPHIWTEKTGSGDFSISGCRITGISLETAKELSDLLQESGAPAMSLDLSDIALQLRMFVRRENA